MDKKNAALGALAGLVLTGAAVGSVSAQSTTEATGLTMQQAIEIALQEVSGEVQEAELENEGGTKIYEVEILDANGQEFEIEIAADTGAVIEVEAEDEGDDDDDDDDET
ncbi:PepSY domain-containing protein [Ruegeria meonggei]|uniref:Peptidase propeptide and YPEB domain protein n=1 Tax=Ruegeria meonggei TaxID=1446476 RepID=A0A1X6YWU4_9RHOB|nr:PepSY domain-containing protein [Ruegeria meonggei]SLN33463.1 Peptidase propeptide and YPEB domain protein [Ruegeria meonggei]